MTRDLLIFLVVIGAAIASMPIFAALGGHRRHDPLESSSRGDFVLGDFVRSWFYWFIRPVERVSLALGLGPLFYNLTGVFFGAVGGYGFATGNLSLGGWGVLLGGAADVLDGRIARAMGVADARGAFLDSSLDRFAEVAAFVGLGMLFAGDPLAAGLVVAGIGGSLMVSYTRARGESLGVVCKGGVMQRAERLLLVGFGGLLDPAAQLWFGWSPGTLLFGVVALVAVGTVGTAVYRTVWIAKRANSAG